MFTLPLRDFWRGFERSLSTGGRGLARVLLGLILGWWIYVPLHELLHAAGCLAAGGEVTRLEIDALYGGAWLEQWIPFVRAGSAYAGQLTGFDTHGSDLVYLATDLAPFLLTIFPGVFALRRFGRRGSALGFGLALPFALAPFLSWSGDAYEIGSLLVVQVPPWSRPELRSLLVGDDLLQRAREVRAAGAPPFGGWALSVALGTLWAFATYAVGAALERALRKG